jgi:hypothetical protein
VPLLLAGAAVIAYVLVALLDEKSAIILGGIGLLSLLTGISLLEIKSLSVTFQSKWLSYVPILIVLFIDLLGRLFSPTFDAIGFAIALTIFCLGVKGGTIKTTIFGLFITFVAASIAFNVFQYYAPNIGVDEWNNLAVAALITHSGHYSASANLPIDLFYSPLPIVSTSVALFSTLTGLSLPSSILIFPDCLILMQPLLVFILARRIFNANESAMLSGFTVLVEPAVLQWISQPIAEAVAVSLVLLFFIFYTSPQRLATRTVTALIFLLITITHAAVAIVAIVILLFLSFAYKRRNNRFLMIVIAGEFLVYLLAGGIFALVTSYVKIDLVYLLGFKSLPQGQPILSGSPGIAFIWWGFPSALGVLSIFFYRKDRTFFVWSFAGLVLLGLAFIGNATISTIGIERYVGLTAWVILATVAGKPLANLLSTRTLVILPVIFIVALSAVMTPTLSPQFGAGGPSLLPATQIDRSSQQWLSFATPNATAGTISTTTYGDSVSFAYLNFLDSERGLSSYSNLAFPSLSLAPTSAGNLILIRWSDIGMSYCNLEGGLNINGKINATFSSVIYSSPCDTIALVS